MEMEFINPVKNDNGCSLCEDKLTEPVTSLQVNTFEMRLCAEHLLKLRTLVIAEHLKRIIIPGASQRRKDGGLPPS